MIRNSKIAAKRIYKKSRKSKARIKTQNRTRKKRKQMENTNPIKRY
jgi:hypothetical protein